MSGTGYLLTAVSVVLGCAYAYVTADPVTPFAVTLAVAALEWKGGEDDTGRQPGNRR